MLKKIILSIVISSSGRLAFGDVSYDCKVRLREGGSHAGKVIKAKQLLFKLRTSLPPSLPLTPASKLFDPLVIGVASVKNQSSPSLPADQVACELPGSASVVENAKTDANGNDDGSEEDSVCVVEETNEASDLDTGSGFPSPAQDSKMNPCKIQNYNTVQYRTHLYTYLQTYCTFDPPSGANCKPGISFNVDIVRVNPRNGEGGKALAFYFGSYLEGDFEYSAKDLRHRASDALDAFQEYMVNVRCTATTVADGPATVPVIIDLPVGG